MKIEWNKKYATIAVYSLIVIFLSIVFYQITSQMNIFKSRVTSSLRIFNPFIIGGVMAYLFNFIMKFYEDRILLSKKFKPVFGKNNKLKRIVGLLTTYITVLLILYIFSNFIFPQIIASISGLVNNIPYYIEETSDLLIDINKRLSLSKEYSDIIIKKWDEFLQTGLDFVTNLIPKFANFIKNIISSLWNVILGVIVSIYILMDKEKFIGLGKKILAASFSQDQYRKTANLIKRAHNIFSKFIGGKILDSVIIGILTFIILKLVKMPFTILVSFIVGLTNIIPFFGPFIGAVPSFIIILFESPVKALWFILIIIIIQQIDGNIIGPKILGDSLGISAFWILFSLLVTGKLFGFIGLVIGVPLFTLIYSIVKDIVENRLRKKGLPVETKDYE